LCPSPAVLPNGGYIFRVHGLPVYLTHWFCMRDRSRAVACLFAALPTASLIGSALAGWWLGVHWWWLAGWRWLFIVEGVPAIVLIIAVFYLTDLPSQAQWLPADERDRLVSELEAEPKPRKGLETTPLRRRSVTDRFSYWSPFTLPGYLGSSGKHLLDTDLR